MEIQKIERMSLHNSAWVIARVKFSYQIGNGPIELSQESGSILRGQTKAIDPGTLGVPAGAKVTMIVDVELGKDHRAKEVFIYQRELNMVAGYELDGKFLGKTNLKFTGLVEAEWRNWSQNIVYSAPGASASYFIPANQAELRAVLAKANEANVVVRVSGQRHSQPPLVVGDNRQGAGTVATEWLVDLTCYADLGNGNDRIELLPGNRVQANTGVTEDELDVFLTNHDLMMQTVTAGGFFSLGGITAVDVNGATVNAPIFAETASGFTFMGADGNTFSIDTGTTSVVVNGQTIQATGGMRPIDFARVNLGALGVVTSVTIDVQPRPHANTLEPDHDEFTLGNGLDLDKTQFVNKFKELLTAHNRIETFYNPYESRFLALWWDYIGNPKHPLANKAVPSVDACMLAGEDIYGAPYESKAEEAAAEATALLAQESDNSALGNILMKAAYGVIKGLFGQAAASYSDLWLTKAARVMFMSYFVELPGIDDAGMERVYDGLNAVATRLKTSNQFQLAGPMEFRFMKGGSAAMAGTYSTNPNAYFVNLDLIGFVKATPGSEYPLALRSFFADIERAWVGLGGFPHNGKMYGFYDPSGPDGNVAPAPFNEGFLQDLITRRGARLQAFKAFQGQADPSGRFANKYVKQLLGLPLA